MRKSARKNRSPIGQTDFELLEAYQRLPVSRQRAYLREILEESRDRQRVVSFEEVLSDPVVLAEAQRLAHGAGIPLRELGMVLNPFRYSSYFARSDRCTIAKLTSIDYGRMAEVAEAVVLVKAYKSVEFHHTIIPSDFDLHVLKGALEIHRGPEVTRVDRTSVAVIEAEGEAKIRLSAGCWMVYLDHPLTTWISARAREKGSSDAPR